MQPPPPLDFVSTETVRQLYAAMPTVFARDIARAKGQSIPPQSVPTLKRERPTDEPELAMMKRRDTGDSKPGTGMPPPATPALAPKSAHSAQPFPGSVPQAAMSDPARMVQMRQQQAQIQAQAAQVQQPHVSGVRQMSPQGTNTGVGMGVGVGQPQVQGQQAAAHANAVQQIVNSFGPQGLALMNQLQDPNNALVKYLVEQIPNFVSLPLQHQLKSMQHAQVRFTTYADPTLANRNIICRILCNRDGLLSISSSNNNNNNRGRLQHNNNNSSSSSDCTSSNINSSSSSHHNNLNNCNNRSTTHSKHSSQTWSIPA